MKKQFVTYKIALKLKELGFNEPCFGYYEVSNKIKDVIRLRFIEHEDTNPSKQPKLSNDCLAPLWQQVIDWFEEKYNIHIWIYYCMILESHFYQIRHELNSNSYDNYSNDLDSNKMHEFSYYESREQAILKAIELI